MRKRWSRRVAELSCEVRQLLGRSCWPGRSCPGPRFRLRLVWPAEERQPPEDEPCLLCGRRFSELSRLEALRAWRSFRLGLDLDDE